MAVEIQARCVNSLPEEGGTSKAGNPWRKKTWIVETLDAQYPKQIALTCMGERIDRLNLQNGKSYILSCDIASREFNGRWYTDVSVFAAREFDQMGAAVQGMQQAPAQQAWNPAPQQPAAPAQQSMPPFGTPMSGGEGFGAADDLPF